MKYYLDDTDNLYEYTYDNGFTTLWSINTDALPVLYYNTIIGVKQDGRVFVFNREGRRLHTLTPDYLRLLPCPFCGSKAVFEPMTTSGQEFTVKCTNPRCYCRSGNDFYESKEDIAKLWNSRI